MRRPGREQTGAVRLALLRRLYPSSGLLPTIGLVEARAAPATRYRQAIAMPSRAPRPSKVARLSRLLDRSSLLPKRERVARKRCLRAGKVTLRPVQRTSFPAQDQQRRLGVLLKDPDLRLAVSQ